MKQIQIFSVEELLQTKSIRFVENKLARALKCHQQTISKYKHDIECKYHHIRKVGNNYVLFISRGRTLNE